jgi:serine/threonine-protein kinase
MRSAMPPDPTSNITATFQAAIARALREAVGEIPSLVGRTLGGYEVLEHLGAGGMGEVYLARSTVLDRRVALKVLPPRLTSDDGQLQRLLQEGKLTSALNHPNIITIHEIGHADDVHFIVTEFVEGETLRQRLTRGAMDVQSAVDVALQVAAALRAAHGTGVIHRDIKPENVMLRPDGYVKVLDFGIAKLRRADPDATDMPIMGTTRYMSPEQARGLEVDERSDIFNLGAVLFEMLTGRPAFEGTTASDAAGIREAGPVLPDEIPGSVAAIVTRALQKDRAARYQTAEELLTALKAVRRDPDGRTRRSRWTMWSAAAVAAAVLVSAGVPADRRLPTGRALGAEPSRALVVLPFINLKPSADTDFLSYSLAETISTRLGHIRTLRVTPSSAVYKYVNQKVDPRQAAQDLKANTVLTGHYMQQDGVLRVSAQLIDVATARAIFQDDFTVRGDRLLTLHDTVARRLISTLSLNLSPAELRVLERDMPRDAQSWELYMRGVDHLEGSRLPLAIHALESSVALDPGFSWAWTELGAAYIANAAVRFGGGNMYGKAQAAFDRAIALSPLDPRPRIMYSDMLIETDRVEAAVPLLREIIKENPRHAGAIWQLGYAYRYAGMLEESAQAGQTAYDVDPGFTPRSTVFNTWLYLGQYTRFRDSIPPRADSAYTRFYQGFAEYHLGHYAAAAAAFDDAYSLDEEMLQARVGKALSHHIAGRRVEGLRLLRDTAQRLERLGVNDAEGVYKVAQAFAVLGDRAAAARWLTASVDGGFFCAPYFATDPLLDNVRDLPQVQAAFARARDRHLSFRRRFF